MELKLSGANCDLQGAIVEINPIRTAINILVCCTWRGFNGGNWCCWLLVWFVSISQMKLDWNLMVLVGITPVLWQLDLMPDGVASAGGVPANVKKSESIVVALHVQGVVDHYTGGPFLVNL